jgi:hypothetical protein
MVGRKTEGGVTVSGAVPGRLLAHGRGLPLDQEPGGEQTGRDSRDDRGRGPPLYPSSGGNWKLMLGESGGKSLKVEDIENSTQGSHPSIDKRDNFRNPEFIGQIKREPGLNSDQSRPVSGHGVTTQVPTVGKRDPRTVPPAIMNPRPFFEPAEMHWGKPHTSVEEYQGMELHWDEETVPMQRSESQGEYLQRLQGEITKEGQELERSLVFVLNQVKVLSERQAEASDYGGDHDLAGIRRAVNNGKSEGVTFMEWLIMDQSLRDELHFSNVDLLNGTWENWRWEKDLIEKVIKDPNEKYTRDEVGEIISVAARLLDEQYEGLVEDVGLMATQEVVERHDLFYQGLVESKSISVATGRIFPMGKHREIMSWYLRLIAALAERERERVRKEHSVREIKTFLSQYPGPAISPAWEERIRSGGHVVVDSKGAHRFNDPPMKTSPESRARSDSQRRREEVDKLGFDNMELARKARLHMEQRTLEGVQARARAEQDKLEEESRRAERALWDRAVQEERRARGQMTEAEARRAGANAGYNYAVGAEPRGNKEYPHWRVVEERNDEPPAEINMLTTRRKGVNGNKEGLTEYPHGGGEQEISNGGPESVGGSMVTDGFSTIEGFEPGETRALIMESTLAEVKERLGELGCDNVMLMRTFKESFPLLNVRTKNMATTTNLFPRVVKRVKPQTKDNFISLAEWFTMLELGCRDYGISLPMRLRLLDRTGGLTAGAKEYEQVIKRVQELIKNIRMWLPEYDIGIEERDNKYWLKIWMKVLVKLVQEFYQNLPVEEIEKGIVKELEYYKIDLHAEDAVNNQFYKVVDAYFHVNTWLRERSSNLVDAALYVWRMLTSWLEKQEPYGPVMLQHMEKALKRLRSDPELVFPANHGLSRGALAEVKSLGAGGATISTYEFILLRLKEEALQKNLNIEFRNFSEMEALKTMYQKNEESKSNGRRKPAKAVNSVATDFSSLSMNTTTTTGAATTGYQSRSAHPECKTCSMHHSANERECPFVDTKNNKFKVKAFLHYRSVRTPNEKGETVISNFWMRQLQQRAFRALGIGLGEGKKIIEQLKAEAKKLPVLTKDDMTKMASNSQKVVALAEKEGLRELGTLQEEQKDVARISAQYVKLSSGQGRSSRRDGSDNGEETESESEYETESGDDDSAASEL